MRARAVCAVAALGLIAFGIAPVAGQVANGLAGDWIVDLSVKPTEPYTRPMKLNLAADGSVTGLFYQSEIENGRWKLDRGRTCVSFRTNDTAGPYHSSACLVGDRVEGQTWAEQRKFLFNWNATRSKAG